MLANPGGSGAWRASGGMSLGKRIETTGAMLTNLVTSMGSRAERLFAEQGLTIRGPNGVLEVEDWYPLDKILAILDRVGDELGDDMVFRLGQAVPKTAAFPRGIDTITRSLASIDIAYHMNHRKDGVPMFDAKSGRMTDGIGYYVATNEGPRCSVVDSSSRYPCPFDLGIIAAMAHQFQARAQVDHLDSARCRRRGAAMCSYVVTW